MSQIITLAIGQTARGFREEQRRSSPSNARREVVYSGGNGGWLEQGDYRSIVEAAGVAGSSKDAAGVAASAGPGRDKVYHETFWGLIRDFQRFAATLALPGTKSPLMRLVAGLAFRASTLLGATGPALPALRREPGPDAAARPDPASLFATAQAMEIGNQLMSLEATSLIDDEVDAFVDEVKSLLPKGHKDVGSKKLPKFRKTIGSKLFALQLARFHRGYRGLPVVDILLQAIEHQPNGDAQDGDEVASNPCEFVANELWYLLGLTHHVAESIDAIALSRRSNVSGEFPLIARVLLNGDPKSLFSEELRLAREVMRLSWGGSTDVFLESILGRLDERKFNGDQSSFMAEHRHGLAALEILGHFTARSGRAMRFHCLSRLEQFLALAAFAAAIQQDCVEPRGPEVAFEESDVADLEAVLAWLQTHRTPAVGQSTLTPDVPYAPTKKWASMQLKKHAEQRLAAESRLDDTHRDHGRSSSTGWDRSSAYRCRLALERELPARSVRPISTVLPEKRILAHPYAALWECVFGLGVPIRLNHSTATLRHTLPAKGMATLTTHWRCQHCQAEIQLRKEKTPGRPALRVLLYRDMQETANPELSTEGLQYLGTLLRSPTPQPDVRSISWSEEAGKAVGEAVTSLKNYGGDGSRVEAYKALRAALRSDVDKDVKATIAVAWRVSRALLKLKARDRMYLYGSYYATGGKLVARDPSRETEALKGLDAGQVIAKFWRVMARGEEHQSGVTDE